MKKYKTIDILWAMSMFIIGAITIILSASRVAGYAMPKVATVLLGVADLIALFILVFTTVRKYIDRKQQTK